MINRNVIGWRQRWKVCAECGEETLDEIDVDHGSGTVCYVCARDVFGLSDLDAYWANLSRHAKLMEE